MSFDRRLCGVDELAVGEARRFDIEGIPICLVRCADGFHAINDICSHENYDLSEGEVDPELCEIECWKHGSVFSLLSGKPETLPATLPVAVYEVIVDETGVILRLDRSMP